MLSFEYLLACQFKGVIMITYSTNFMGPIAIPWYENNKIPYQQITRINPITGTKTTTKKFMKNYAGGRIDVRGTEDPYGLEIGVPIMEAESWNELQQFLWTFTSKEVLTLQQIVQALEDETGFSIVWFKEPV